MPLLLLCREWKVDKGNDWVGVLQTIGAHYFFKNCMHARATIAICIHVCSGVKNRSARWGQNTVPES